MLDSQALPGLLTGTHIHRTRWTGQDVLDVGLHKTSCLESGLIIYKNVMSCHMQIRTSCIRPWSSWKVQLHNTYEIQEARLQQSGLVEAAPVPFMPVLSRTLSSRKPSPPWSSFLPKMRAVISIRKLFSSVCMSTILEVSCLCYYADVSIQKNLNEDFQQPTARFHLCHMTQFLAFICQGTCGAALVAP